MKRAKHSFLFNLIVTTFVIFCAMTIIKLEIEINKQSGINSSLAAENERLRYENDHYKNELDTPIDDEYIEKVCREQFNLRLPEEIVFYNDLIN